MVLSRSSNTKYSLGILALTLALAATNPAHAQQDNGHLSINKDNRTIAITATDRVLSEADTATVHIGFRLYGPDKDTTYASGSQASNAIMDALLHAGVPKNTIESESQSLDPVDQGEIERLLPKDRAGKAFVIQQTWTVRANAADSARILDLAVKTGANQSGQIDWSLHDPDAAQSAAATKAIQRARTQASAMAAGLNVKLGALLYASNQVDAAPVRPRDQFIGGMMHVAKQAVEPLAINARQIETSATVYAVFALD